MALGNEALTIEKLKSNILGTYLCMNEVVNHHVEALIMKPDVIATFVVNAIRSSRFGDAEATGRANLIAYHYLLEQGAIARKVSGKYSINYANLGALILKIQATGDYAAAADLVDKYAQVSSTLKADIVNLELEKIPVDIRVSYE